MACENGNDIRRSERESRPGSQDQSVWQEKIVELRRSRAGIAGSLTVKEEELLKVLQEKEASDEIKVKSESLSRTLSEFERCCRYLCLYLETHKLYDELTEAQSYNETIITRVQQVLKTARERTALDTEARVIHKGTDRECGDSLHPEDSVSRSGRHSHVSTTSSARARASAKRAALQAKAKVMEEVMKKRMEVEHLKLRKTEEELGLQQLELEAEIAATTAEERELLRIESTSNASASVYGETRGNTEKLCKKVGRDACGVLPGVLPDFGTYHGNDNLNLENLPSRTLNPLAAEWPNSLGEGRVFESHNPRYVVNKPRVYDHVRTSISDQRELIDILQLPKSEIMKYDGDSLKYWLFIRTFDNCVGCTSADSAYKLNRLLQYCTGKALKVIECCAMMKPDEGYHKARQLLKERFGNDYQISEAWIKKIVDRPVLRSNDKEGFQNLADDMRNCRETLQAIGKLSEIDTRTIMVKILEQLPLFVQSRWRTTAIRTLDEYGQYPNIAMFVEFLEQVAKEVNDPVFGFTVQERPRDVRNPKRISQVKGKGVAFAIQASENQSQSSENKVGSPSCWLCSQAHQLRTCPQFLQASPMDRLDTVKKMNICFNCLGSTRHHSKSCRIRIFCNIEGCKGKHSKLLHKAFQEGQFPRTTNTVQETDPHTVVAQSCVCTHQSDLDPIALPICPVRVRRNEGENEVLTYALLDPGSSRSFCSLSLVKSLGIAGHQTDVSLMTLTDKRNSSALQVSLELSSLSNTKKRKIIQLPRVLAITGFPVMSSISTPPDKNRWKHLMDIEFPQADSGGVSLIIGQDFPHLLVPHEVRSGRDGEPYAVRTLLGWTLNGPIGEDSKIENDAICNFIYSLPVAESHLDQQVERFWKLDNSQDIDESDTMSLNDKRVVEMWKRSVVICDGHYQLDIPFKLDPPELPCNISMAEKRLKSLARRLSRDSSLHDRYTYEMEQMLSKGYAERVENSQIEGTPGKIWYIPHHNVFNPKKPDKCRIVFDCAAEYEGTSLNKRVLQGPDLTNKLVGVLLRFRENKVAVCGDIQEMFHQVRVSPQHRDALRFLWWPQGDLTTRPAVYRMNVHLFGGVWSPSCANFALQLTANDHEKDFSPEVIQTVLKNFYVDDCLKSVSCDDDAIALVEEVTRILLKGGFQIKKWLSNSKRVVESIPSADRGKKVMSLELEEGLPSESVLGLVWHMDKDSLGIQVRPKEKDYTRRGLLSVMSSVYDPLGFVGPYILQAKKIFQDECRLRKGWDENLEEGNIIKWKKWLSQVGKLNEFRLERCYIPRDFGQITSCRLHNFCDASAEAYGSVSYLRVTDDTGRVHCSFLMAKSRLAPIKPLTIPRLELLAAVMAVKVNKQVAKELIFNLEEPVYWTDSMIVLQYIKNEDKRLQTFVANRVSVINDGSLPRQWRYVNTKLNPADDASRGLSAADVVSSRRWLQGPDFLWGDESQFPLPPSSYPDLLQHDREVKGVVKSHAIFVANEDKLDELFNRYSCWFKLRKGIAWLLLFRRWIASRSLRDSHSFGAKTHLEVSDLEAGEVAVRYLQNRYFKDEIKALVSNGRVSKQSKICKLDPFLDKGIIRVGGRLCEAPITDSSKHPMVLPRDHHIIKLIVRYVHEVEAKHSGREYVLAVLREKYWIPQVRPLINKVLSSCITCMRVRCDTGTQKMACLPTDRVTPGDPAFTNVGIDCFGPFLVKRGRGREKRYGCLFTCLAIRAIHIEKLHSLDTDSFINALSRFAARRGLPKKIRCDNGTNFIGGERELREAVQQWNDSHKIREYMLRQRIVWEFNPPTASHMGGVWERQIRSVRKILKCVLHQQLLDDERLDTVLCEAEAIVNGRPLTLVSGDPQDWNAITPNSLLLLRPTENLPGKYCKADQFRRHWRHAQYLADRFWKRWVHEYLPTLQLRQKWQHEKRNFQEGDVVLLKDESTTRGTWPLGRVSRIHKGKDGLVRSVDVKTRKGVLKRPISKLCLLESELGISNNL
ncbi:hypothetical protein Pmani_000412 [Petrolisthes manimaculis]|uniref:Integrase catalytic domain-containing protein n=1 Tax=Petrolisthes manimaculis TaxID=1843537 RepID=A0AAE1QMG3_9EUCA|nr:hypothetical protein Pmani_000412 [Petrolisthes manimaculis]